MGLRICIFYSIQRDVSALNQKRDDIVAKKQGKAWEIPGTAISPGNPGQEVLVDLIKLLTFPSNRVSLGPL